MVIGYPGARVNLYFLQAKKRQAKVIVLPSLLQAGLISACRAAVPVEDDRFSAHRTARLLFLTKQPGIDAPPLYFQKILINLVAISKALISGVRPLEFVGKAAGKIRTL